MEAPLKVTIALLVAALMAASATGSALLRHSDEQTTRHMDPCVPQDAEDRMTLVDLGMNVDPDWNQDLWAQELLTRLSRDAAHLQIRIDSLTSRYKLFHNIPQRYVALVNDSSLPGVPLYSESATATHLITDLQQYPASLGRHYSTARLIGMILDQAVRDSRLYATHQQFAALRRHWLRYVQCKIYRLARYHDVTLTSLTTYDDALAETMSPPNKLARFMRDLILLNTAKKVSVYLGTFGTEVFERDLM